MIRKKKEPTHGKLEIDLTGPDGNAFVLLGTASKLCKQLNRDLGAGLEWDKIQKVMTASDYENLVNAFDEYFGDYVILYR